MKKSSLFLFFCLALPRCFSQVTLDKGPMLVGESVRAADPMVLVEGGTFRMGSTNGEAYERPVHTVKLNSFYMGKYEVTQEEWMELMDFNPSNFKGDNLPVENVHWFEAVEYCNKLSLKEGLNPAYRGSGSAITCDFSACGYRLPTEAEWEYAAKGGNRNAKAFEYAGGNRADSVAWHNGNSGSRTRPVGTKEPNSLGLYDMSGNVFEWCWDRYGPYSSDTQVNPQGPSDPALDGYRVIRGGSYDLDARYVRTAYRDYGSPSSRNLYQGFRLVRP
ncbi:MAG: formylglycine-generating enzyme family protein [Treponema sp.]|jgi:formylglycine-generating enzyme required for sulfatase activity|nr:formylglycine-generating enzyme family protein [Treponema sp.]